jgi:mRNA interferase RelE/StbE
VARYRILIKPSAVREIEAIPQKRQRQRVVSRIRALAEDPRPPGCEKLSSQDRYRVRQAAYRIVYSVKDDVLVVYVVKAGQGGNVYR